MKTLLGSIVFLSPIVVVASVEQSVDNYPVETLCGCIGILLMVSVIGIILES